MNMMDNYTRNMLKEARRLIDESNGNIEIPKFSNNNVLNEEASNNGSGDAFVVKKNDAQFGSVRDSQEDSLRKTIGDVKFDNDSLKYYSQINDLVLNAEINGLGVKFQFRYNDPSGDGCYIWANGLQLTDANQRTLNKVRDSFLNWKQTLIEDGDLMSKLKKEADKKE